MLNIVLAPCKFEMPLPESDLFLVGIVAAHQGIYATILNYLEMELRYMDAGKRGPKAPTLGHRGTPGHHSHVSYHDIDHRHALAALGGTDQR
jgi:hypothetical protein